MNSFALIRKTTPATALIVGCLMSLVLVLLSFTPLVDVAEFERAGKEVGYKYSLNWAYGFTLVAPLFFFFMLSALYEMERSALDLGARGMLVDLRFDPPPQAVKSFGRRWASALEKNAKWALLLTLLGVGYTVYEWWGYSGQPLLSGGVPAEGEWDWSVKFAVAGELADRRANAGFSALVFGLQAVFIFYLMHFVVALASFWRLIRSLVDGSDTTLQLIPDVTDEDPRRGFQVFKDLTMSVLLTIGLGYVLFYLSRVWNAFLHAPVSTTSEPITVYDFVIGDLVAGVRASIESEQISRVLEVLAESLTDIGDFSFSEYWVTLGAIVLFLLGGFLTIRVLRTAAIEANRNLVAKLSEGSGRYRGAARSQVAQRLTQQPIRTWPMGYPHPNQLLIMGAFALVGFIWFRVGLVVIGMLLVMLVRRGVELMTSPSS